MKLLSNNYNLEEIEEYRKKLNNIIIEKNNNLLDEEVLHLSQTLDDLIYQYLLLKKIKNIIDIKLN